MTTRQQYNYSFFCWEWWNTFTSRWTCPWCPVWGCWLSGTPRWVCERVCVCGGGGGVNVLGALHTLALSLACLDMSISFQSSRETPLISLSHTHTHTCVHMKKGRHPPAHAHSITLTLQTLSHNSHTMSSRSGWLPERLIHQTLSDLHTSEEKKEEKKGLALKSQLKPSQEIII